MSWLRIDDGFTNHPKLLALRTDQRRWTWLCVLTYTCRFRSAVIPAEIGNVVSRATSAFLNDCIRIGLIDLCDGEMRVHDWEPYQAGDPKKALRQAKWRERVDGDVDGDVDALVDGDVDASRAGARARPVPSPTPEEQELPPGDTPSAQPLTAFFIDESRRRSSDPPKRVVGQFARAAKNLLDQGHQPEQIKAGIVAMLDKGKGPSLLEQFVFEAGLTKPETEPYPYDDSLPLGGLRHLTPADRGLEWSEEHGEWRNPWEM